MNPRVGLVVRAMVLILGVVGLAGCVVEPPLLHVNFRNSSDTFVDVHFGDSLELGSNAPLEPGETGRLPINGDEQNCDRGSMVTAWTAEGTLVGTFGPPLCDGDEWVITQGDVDKALAGQQPTPTPTEQSSE